MKRNETPARIARDLVGAASSALKKRMDEVNRLNVFPVPDGDTGTNMSLTMDTVVRELANLDPDATLADACHAVSHGSLMGARGNSGVILSQILRGLCEGIDSAEAVDTALLSSALDRAVTVSYQAVRKPVEGTMLTVVKDTALAAGQAQEKDLPIEEALEYVAAAAFDSVKRTPELLPVLKENGVVDAGGLGVAVLLEGFVAAALGHETAVSDIVSEAAPLLHIEPADDWDDDEYLYCTEFLLFGPAIDREAVHAYVSAVGGSELVVGDSGEFKVHVHTNDPGDVLTHVLENFGEVAEVHVNNMRRQQAARSRMLSAEEAGPEPLAPPKPMGFVAVATGQGLKDILTSLGVDEVVSGGQTMNPSTSDLLAAIDKVKADAVLVLPNNKNIVMTANAAASVSTKPVGVVPTHSIPAAFAALLAFDGTHDLKQAVDEMSAAADTVRIGEVTVAIKDAKGKAGDIHAGQVIGILDDEEIEFIGTDVDVVAEQLAGLLAEDAETLTLFAGAEYADERLERLRDRISQNHPDLEVETHRGEQPLYPLIMSAE